MNPSVSLCCVAGGRVYQEYAAALMESAKQHFWPSMKREFHVIEGEEHWPRGTMYRYHRLLEQWPDSDYVFLCDADMRFEDTCGPEILGEITATLHPGYVTTPPDFLPFERREESACQVSDGDVYYCGGFIGGENVAFHVFAEKVKLLIDWDVKRNIVPHWHDESAVNAVLHKAPPAVTLPPSYCHPDGDAHYRVIWPEQYPRILVALDKSAEHRGGR